jgi:hypothetical protein
MSNQRLAFKEHSAHFNECVNHLASEVLQLVRQVERSGTVVCALIDVLAYVISNCYADKQEALHLVATDLERLVEEHLRAQAREAHARKSTTAEGLND